MRISIITPSKNSALTIEDTVRSVLSQKHADVEYVIMDGGSTDGTLEIIKKYQDRISKVVSEKDNGIYDAMNKGITQASGEVIGILNSDDIYFDDNVLNKVAQTMERSQSDVCWGDILIVKKDDINKITRTWKSSEYKPGFFQKGGQIPHPSFFIRKSAYEKYGVYNPKLRVFGDYELGLRLLEKYKVSSSYIPEVLVKMREAGDYNWKNILHVIRINRNIKQAWQINGLKMPWYTILLKVLGKIKQVF